MRAVEGPERSVAVEKNNLCDGWDISCHNEEGYCIFILWNDIKATEKCSGGAKLAKARSINLKNWQQDKRSTDK